MSPARWAEIRSAFDALVQHDSAARKERLDALGASDPDLRRAVEDLLAADAEADARLNRVEDVFAVSSGDPAETPEPASDRLGLAGRVIGHFRIVEPVAAGGMGVVYRAEDTHLQRSVALKFPLPEQRLDRDAKERFLREARAAGALDHPNVCRIHEAGETDDGHVFLAMPLYQGQTLRARLAAEGRLSVREALAIAAQVASGLAAAHRAGIIHRDLKPGNVMLLPDGTAKLLDFGLASSGAARTASRGRLGTLSSMAPEQVRGESVDARADLWALGVLLYELLTGRRPFEDENERSVSRAILHDEPIPPSALRAELDPELEQLVLQLLRKDATERPTSADEVGSRLNALASPPLPLGGARQGRRRSLQPVAVVLVIVAVAGVIAGVRLLADHVGSPSVRENAVMVMPFRTSERSPNADLGEGLADLLSLRLTGEPGPEAIDMRMTLNALRAAGDPSPAQLTSMAALRIARSAGVGQVVLGEIIEARGRLVVTGTLHDGSGARKATVSGAPDSLLSLADRLAAQLLGRAAGEDEQSLESMTSSSLAAVRAYLLGRSAYRRGEFGTAVRSYRTALDYDSTFALAALGLELAVVWGQPDALGAWGSRLAVQHRDRLPPRDRALVELLYMNLDEPPRERLRRFEQYTQRYPDRPEGWVGLGEHLYHAGGDAVVGPIGELSLAAFRRAIELEPRHPAAYIHVIDVLAFREDTATLRQTTDAFRTILSASSTSTSAAAASLWLAATVLEDSVRLASIRAGLESLPDNGLTSIPLYAWRSAVDPTDAEHALDIAERRASTAERLAHVRYIRFMLFLNTGRPGLARAALERWGQAVDDPGRTWSQVLHIAYPEGDTTGTGIGERRLASLMIDGDPYADGRRYCMLGLIAHRKGRLTSAHLPALRRRVAAGGEALPLLPCLRALEAVLAHANEVPDARARLAVLDSVLERTPYSPTWSVQWPQLISVQLHRERGELEAALHAVNLICGGCFLHTPATLERARINALLGNHAEAIHYYRHYLRLLANPEPGPATELAKTARTELARLLP